MDLPVFAFIQQRLNESDTTYETREGSAFYDLFIKPQQLMLQPLVSALDNVLIGQSVRRILALTDPNSFDAEQVNDLAANLYVFRDDGGFARTTARIFYQTPVDREYPAFTTEFDALGNLSFFNEFDFVITSEQMALQQVGNLFFMDVPIRAQNPGSDYNVAAGGITEIVNDPDAVNVTSLVDAVGGLPQENNVALLDRTRNSIGVRDLETIKGINAILREKFPLIREIVAIGMGDAEMMRDILYNAHVGGKTDVYIKTPTLQKLSTNVIGLQFDTTRVLHRNIHRSLTATDVSDPNADLQTPFIVPNSVIVKDSIIETAAFFITASIPPVTGIDLSAGQFIKLQDNNDFPVNIRVAGATPTATQRFEVIDAINAGVGKIVATPYAVDQIKVTSEKIGIQSTLKLFKPDGLRTDGTTTLIPSATSAGYQNPTPADPAIYQGVAADVYVEGVDYQVDYSGGTIIKLTGSAILSGDTITGPSPLNTGSVTTGSDVFSSTTPNVFQLVAPGDTLVIDTIDPGTGMVPGVYVITQKINNQQIRIQGMSPTGIDPAVVFSVTSNQVVIIDLDYNPLSVDVGPNVLLSDGFTRGIRPGRDAFTIKDVAFIDVISVEEIDPDTEEGLGIFLTPPGGYGSGGYGLGSYGGGNGGGYHLVVNRPTERFSAFEDSVLVFDPTLFGKSYKITYYAATEIAQIHAVCRNDLERVTGADVLPKNFVPIFVDVTILIKRDPTNLVVPDNAALSTTIAEFINTVKAGSGLEASDLIRLLEDAGVDNVRVPFTMTGTVINTDGSTRILQNIDVLIHPDVVLPKETDNFVTPRITHMFNRNVVVTEF